MRSARGIEPPPIKSPITALRERNEAKKERKKAQEIADEWETFENFDGYTDAERKYIDKGGDDA
jgi:hypothetical protein